MLSGNLRAKCVYKVPLVDTNHQSLGKGQRISNNYIKPKMEKSNVNPQWGNSRMPFNTIFAQQQAPNYSRRSSPSSTSFRLRTSRVPLPLVSHLINSSISRKQPGSTRHTCNISTTWDWKGHILWRTALVNKTKWLLVPSVVTKQQLLAYYTNFFVLNFLLISLMSLQVFALWELDYLSLFSPFHG